MQIGAQLYTVYNHTTTLEDFSNTLKKVASLGYKAVQVSGTCPFEPEWLREELLKKDIIPYLKAMEEIDLPGIMTVHKIFENIEKLL